MLAGHTMMKVFAGLIIMMGSAGGLLKISGCTTTYGSNWFNRVGISCSSSSSICFKHINMYVFTRCNTFTLIND